MLYLQDVLNNENKNIMLICMGYMYINLIFLKY